MLAVPTLLLAVCAVLAGGFLVTNLVNPAFTARSVVATGDWWLSHWPFERGKSLWFRLNGMLYRVGVFKPIVARTRSGMTMELDSRDLVSQTILMTGMWDPKVTAFVDGNLHPGDVFIDVGAHVGYCSLLASRAVGAEGKVIAVEPNPPTIARLERNIRLNHADNIVVRKVASTDAETTLRFFQAGVENTGRSSVNQNHARGGSEISVAGVPLDRMVQSLGLSRVDLVKIDVEGAEMQVLAGMTDILARYRPKIVVELRFEFLENMGSSLAAAEAFFRANGYTLQDRDNLDNYFWVPAPGQPAAFVVH